MVLVPFKSTYPFGMKQTMSFITHTTEMHSIFVQVLVLQRPRPDSRRLTLRSFLILWSQRALKAQKSRLSVQASSVLFTKTSGMGTTLQPSTLR